MMISKDKKASAAVVFEYKVGKSQEELAAKVEETLEQIEVKDYWPG